MNMQSCIEACEACHRVCLETIVHCLKQGGAHAEARHILLLMDCAQICHTSADFMIRQSAHHADTCGTCAHVCAACADDCERLGQNDRMMQACAEACRRCAEECRQMAREHA